MRALYYFQVDGDIKCMLATHVDDMIWGAKEGFEYLIDELLAKFSLKKVEQGNFRFCGREVRQDDDFTIHVTCKDNAEKVEVINYDLKGRKPTDAAFDYEISQLRSVVGSLAWVSRQCRPDLSYGVSKLQSICTKARVLDLGMANKLVREGAARSDTGLHFHSGTFRWSDMIAITVSDASHANEESLVGGVMEPHRSQRGRMTLLGDSRALTEETAAVHVISFSSTLIKRICRGTLQAETYALQGGVEETMRVRAAIVDMMGKLDIKRWESTAASAMKHVWMTDCKSLEEHLKNPTFSKCADKRLSIEVAALRQLLWMLPDETVVDELGELCPDTVRWIDTSTMPCDCLTKYMKPDRLLEMLRTGVLDLAATAQSILIKMRKQKSQKGIPADSTEQVV
jgi:hypothetical protein